MLKNLSARSTGLVSLAYSACLMFQVGFRLMSQRDQETIPAMYEAISKQAGLYVAYAVALCVGSLLFGFLQLTLAEQGVDSRSRRAVGLRVSAILATMLWIAGTGVTLYQALDAERLMQAVSVAGRPELIEQLRNLAGKVALSLAGVSIILTGFMHIPTFPRRRWLLLLAALAGLYGFGIWIDAPGFHRIGGGVYALWFILTGILMLGGQPVEVDRATRFQKA